MSWDASLVTTLVTVACIPAAVVTVLAVAAIDKAVRFRREFRHVVGRRR